MAGKRRSQESVGPAGGDLVGAFVAVVGAGVVVVGAGVVVFLAEVDVLALLHASVLCTVSSSVSRHTSRLNWAGCGHSRRRSGREGRRL